MAKSKKSGSDEIVKSSTSNKGFLSNIIKDVSKKSEIVVETRENAIISKPFDSGVYIFNALLNKSIRKGGFSGNRITILAGGSGTGKSYLAYGAARNAQKDGYTVVLIDTEFAAELDELESYGIDTSEERFHLIRGNVVEELVKALAQILNALKIAKKEGKTEKMLIIVDSLGMLASNKEIEDAIKGDNKQDMTRAKAIRRFFRIVTSDLGYLQIPMICTNHTYKDISAFFPTDIMNGGEGVTYAGSTIVFLSTAQYKTGNEGEMDLTSGTIITAKSKKNRKAIPKKIKMILTNESGLNPYSGLDMFCTKENFDKVGIAKVKITDDGKVVDNNKWYVKHLNKHIAERNLFTPAVFTNEVLDALEPIIYDFFSYSKFDDLEKQFDKIKDDFDIDEDIVENFGLDDMDKIL